MAKEKENLNADTLDETLKQIQKLFGKGSVMRLGDRGIKLYHYLI